MDIKLLNGDPQLTARSLRPRREFDTGPSDLQKVKFRYSDYVTLNGPDDSSDVFLVYETELWKKDRFFVDSGAGTVPNFKACHPSEHTPYRPMCRVARISDWKTAWIPEERLRMADVCGVFKDGTRIWGSTLLDDNDDLDFEEDGDEEDGDEEDGDEEDGDDDEEDGDEEVGDEEVGDYDEEDGDEEVGDYDDDDDMQNNETQPSEHDHPDPDQDGIVERSYECKARYSDTPRTITYILPPRTPDPDVISEQEKQQPKPQPQPRNTCTLPVRGALKRQYPVSDITGGLPGDSSNADRDGDADADAGNERSRKRRKGDKALGV
ncbi:hypothetical protein A1O3_04362 [Capronia epimyces CBS 606.96]|uniref:Uncharacterized protein n=1 Tax=Capronia epimyces CBS 606.96 TaxID=1182542 RepID=W9Y3N4_9EURO|nr:uncharacterized protein A1O3_04362 [Capronia epimyces CBS 606.96]EXJ87402.1 hypothetical protein A1O3_04362 [Capronia epimyces CBS 606.96]